MGRGVPAGIMIGLLGVGLSCRPPSTVLQPAGMQGPTRWGTNGYVAYEPGSMPLIIVIPHGGTLEPPEMADRISGTLGRYDTNTLELGRSIATALLEQTGRSPYLIITHVHRKKLDTNRDLLEAAQDDSLGMQAWEEFHAFIDEAKADVVTKFGSGLLVDLHGHRHTRPWMELGYLLSPVQLALPDDSLNAPDLVAAASIGGLVKSTGRSLAGLLHGPLSLGALLEEEGYESVPAPSNPHPRGDHYFSGGYNTERHGSLDGGAIVAVQVETPWHGVRDTEASRDRFARAAASALGRFLEIHFVHQGE